MKYLTYQKFTEIQSAKALCDLLQENNIDFLLENGSKSFDPTFVVNELNEEYNVKIKKEDFEKADDVTMQISMALLNNVPQDYYLYTFTNDELMDIVAKKDEWNQFDFLLAQKILKEKGITVDKEQIDTLFQQRMNELAKPITCKKEWIFIGYLVALLGGALAIIIGWHLFTYKKLLPNGNKVAGYSLKDRNHGYYMMIIGILFFILWFVFKPEFSLNYLSKLLFQNS